MIGPLISPLRPTSLRIVAADTDQCAKMFHPDRFDYQRLL